MLKRWRIRGGGARIDRPAIKRDQLLDRLGVEWDHPVLQALLYVLAEMEDEAQEIAGSSGSGWERRKEAVVAMTMAIEAQRRLRALVDKGRKRQKERFKRG